MSAGTGQVAVVTGVTGAMGRVIALQLSKRGFHVVAVVRDARRAEDLRQQIARESGRAALEVIEGDLSSRAGIASAAGTVSARHEAVHLLVNNAGAHFPDRRLTIDGVEQHIAVDFLAAYGLTALLKTRLMQARGRVVNVVSDTLRDTRRVALLGPPRPATLDLHDIDDVRRLNPAEGFEPFQAYARAKLLTLMVGYDLATELAGKVTVNAVHPGIVDSDIIDGLVPALLKPLTPLIRARMLPPEAGAAAALRLAIDPALQETTGRYFVREIDTRAPDVSDRRDLQQRVRAAADRFFEITASK